MIPKPRKKRNALSDLDTSEQHAEQIAEGAEAEEAEEAEETALQNLREGIPSFT